MIPDSIEREIVIDAPVQRVWDVLTGPAQMPEWFGGATATIDLQPGGGTVFRWDEHGTFHGTIERIEPPHAFAFRWALTKDATPRRGNSTLVEFTLTPEGGGTRLRVVESGFRELDGTEESKAEHVASNRHGWADALAGLKAYAQQAPDAHGG